MPFPNCQEKYDSEPIITPQKRVAYREQLGADEIAAIPEAVILCYSRGLMEYLTDSYEGRYVEGGYIGDLYAFVDTQHDVGVLGNFGVGSPVVSMLMEELIGDGVETFLSIGVAGCLDDTVEMGDYIVCDKAIRDEGTSHHYIEDEKYAYASDSVIESIQQELQNRDVPYHLGPSWTIDAIYRETEVEVERYAGEGVLTVDMEAAAVLTVANYRGVEAGSIFIVSDYLGPSEWEPQFHLTEDDMRNLGETTKDILTSHVT